MTRSVVLATLLVATVAHADMGTLPGGATISFNRFFLHENNSQTLIQPQNGQISLWHYFNLAHCVCGQFNASTPIPNYFETTFAYELLLQGQTTPIHAPLEIWVGTMCDADAVTRAANCHKIDGAGTADIASIMATNGIIPEVPVFDLMNPEPPGSTMAPPAPCTPRTLSTAEWAISDVNPDGTLGSTPQYFVSKGIDTNTLPPPLPASFQAEGADGAIAISWTPPQGNVASVAYYQVLCSNVDDTPAVSSGITSQYQTPQMLCGGSAPSIALTATVLPADGSVDAGVVDAGSVAPGPNLQSLDPSFICGQSMTATDTSLRVDGLTNGVPYIVVFLAIDKFGNPAGTYFTSTLTPKPVDDFWQDLHDRGSHAQGGFCLIAETYGDDNPLTEALRGFRDGTLASSAFGRALSAAYYGSLAKLGAVVHGHLVLRVVSGVLLLPLVAVALLWNLLTLPGLLVLVGLVVLRRRLARSRLVFAVAAVALVVLVPVRAHAQTPYWEDPRAGDVSEPAAEETDHITWHAGVRVGPYVPQIDAQLGMSSNGPYGQMFGGYSLLPMLDVDRILWRGFGQLGIGVSAGFLSKTAHAWVIGCATCTPGNPDRPRSPGDKNSFRMIPLQVTAVYRLTTLDDDYGVPIVPYARGGLGYYAWWSTGPNGSFASSCTGPTMPGCATTKAFGASLGLVGSIGLAIRAERIDSAAARSMRESGIEHAGFYAEYSLAKVDGFGSSSKLAVGDNTWFAGVDFEF